jgi:hypothetical protein
VVTKLDGNVSPPVKVTSYNPLSNDGSGQIVLSTDPSTAAVNRICLQHDGASFSGANNTKTSAQSCGAASGDLLPDTARPVGTPTVVLRADGLGFQVITSWYDPTAVANNCSGGSHFNYGKSYITVHEFGADGSFYQLAGVILNDTVLTGSTFVGTSLFIDGINAGSAPQSIGIGETFSPIQQLHNTAGNDRYQRTSWSERMSP